MKMHRYLRDLSILTRSLDIIVYLITNQLEKHWKIRQILPAIKVKTPKAFSLRYFIPWPGALSLYQAGA